MSIEYYIIDPIGNITALVTSNAAKSDYKDISGRIMAENPGVEQVGFAELKEDVIKLNMAGGEFCGNATMSAAALKYELSQNTGEVCRTVLVEPLGVEVKVNVSGGSGVFDCECLMPPPKEIENYTFFAGGRRYTYPLVCFDGIMHIIADGDLPENAAEGVIKDLAKQLGAPALGIMIFDKNENRLVPLVYVEAVNTVFFEKSCASGTCALAAAMGFCEKTDIIEPGGTMGAQLQKNGISLSLRLKIIKHVLEE